MTIRLELDHPEVHAGGQLNGRAIWTADGGKHPRKISAILRWTVVASGLDRREIVDRADQPLAGGEKQAVLSFAFEVPDEPLSYEGKLFNIVWEVVVNADLPMARDESESKVISVLPRIWSDEDREFYSQSEDEE